MFPLFEKMCQSINNIMTF